MVQLELDPKVERQLIDAAKARGLKPEAYVSQLIESAVSLTAEKHPNLADMQRFFDGMASLSDKIPILPDEAFTRECFYKDHG